jgi:hypothetical protein
MVKEIRPPRQLEKSYPPSGQAGWGLIMFSCHLSSPDYSPGPRQGGAHCVAELVRVLAVTFGGGQTSHEVCYGRVNNPG